MSLVKIDSSARSSGTPGSFTIDLNQNLNGVYRLKQMYVPNSFYNVYSGNNSITWSIAGVTNTALVPVGFYTIATFVPAVQTALNSVGATGFVVTLNSLTQNVTVTNTANFQLLFGSYQSNSLATPFGFAAVDTTPIFSSGAENFQATGTLIINMSTVQCYHVDIGESSGVQNIAKNSQCGNYAYVMPILSDSQGLDFFQPRQEEATFVDLRSLKVIMKDINGSPLPLLADWYCVLEYLRPR